MFQSLLALLPWLIAMIVLMAFSGFFSASEAALFYLRPRDRSSLRGGNRAQRLAAELMLDPDRLLSAVLFWNLVINIAYFTLSSICAIKIDQDENLGQGFAVFFACFSLLSIIFFSEMLPKSLAVLKPKALASTVSVPLSVAIRMVDPVMPFLKSINTVSQRLFFPGFKSEPYMEITDLEKAIEHSGNDAALIKQEQAVLQNIVQLSEIRIDEWMRPRTQFVTFNAPVSLADLAGTVPASGYLLISEANTEEVEQAIRLDNQFGLPKENIERFAEPVLYLPWCATVADALEKMSHKDREVTAVVNEHGDTIGILTVEDILETVFTYAPSRSKRILDLNPLHKIEKGKWIVSGMMSLRQLARTLDVETPSTHSVTVGGVIQESMQRLAQKNDICDWGPFHLRVVEAPHRGNMIVELTMLEEDGA